MPDTRSPTPPAYENPNFLNVIEAYLQVRRPRDDYKSSSVTVSISA